MTGKTPIRMLHAKRVTKYQGVVSDDMAAIADSPYIDKLDNAGRQGGHRLSKYGVLQNIVIVLWMKLQLQTPDKDLDDLYRAYCDRHGVGLVGFLATTAHDIGHDMVCHMLHVLWARNLEDRGLPVVGAMRYHLPDMSDLNTTDAGDTGIQFTRRCGDYVASLNSLTEEQSRHGIHMLMVEYQTLPLDVRPNVIAALKHAAIQQVEHTITNMMR